ncbi:protein kinase-like domain, concanavalin A-like lectin/glucanase domain protein [Tanacetum coccineum]
MVGQFLKKQAYIDRESPIDVMLRLNYYWNMSDGLKSRRKPSNPKKIANFISMVKGLKVFVGNFTYECDFVVLEDTTNVIDHYLGGMVLGKPFVKETGLVYDKDEGTVKFEKEGEKIIFEMPHKMEMFKHIIKDILKKDNIPSFIATMATRRRLTT